MGYGKRKTAKIKGMKISQSLLKDVADYQNEAICGNVLKAKWIDDTFPDDYDSDSMALGCYFEYIFTLAMTGKGSLPKSGKTPAPDYYAAFQKKVLDAIKSGKPVPVGTPEDMLKPYQTAHQNCDRLIGYFRDMGIEIVEAGVRKTKGNHEGTIDLICRWIATGEMFVIDLKYSGLIYEKWSRHGWMWEPIQRDYHSIQAKEYHYLTGLPFYFMVVSSANTTDIKFFQVILDDFTIEQHVLDAKDKLAKMNMFNKIGFTPHPTLERCTNCCINAFCKDKKTVPDTVRVDLRLND